MGEVFKQKSGATASIKNKVTFINEPKKVLFIKVVLFLWSWSKWVYVIFVDYIFAESLTSLENS